MIGSVDGALHDRADVTHNTAADIGATREIRTIDDCALAVTWAAAADREGVTGLQHVPRSITGNGKPFALFGDDRQPVQAYRASQPPSTGSTIPWMYDAAGEHRKCTAPPMSFGSAQRPAGIRAEI